MTMSNSDARKRMNERANRQPLNLDALEALAEAATPGPWTAHEGDLEGKSVSDYLATLVGNREKDGTTTGRLFLTLAPNPIDPELGAEVVPATTGDGPTSEANAAFIAAARTAVPALVAEVRMLRGQKRVNDQLAESSRLADRQLLDLRARLEAAERTSEGWKQAFVAEADRMAALRDAITQLADEWATPGEFRGADNNATRTDCAKELRRFIQSDTGGTHE